MRLSESFLMVVLALLLMSSLAAVSLLVLDFMSLTSSLSMKLLPELSCSLYLLSARFIYSLILINII